MNILIIEDDPDFVSLLVRSCEQQKLVKRVRSVSSYEEFCHEIPRMSTYDVVLLDLFLHNDLPSDPSGFRILRMIRDLGHVLPVIVISGGTHIEAIEEAFDLGATDYIVKNIRLRELEVRILNWFKRYILSNKVYMRNNLYSYHGLQYDPLKNEFSYSGKLLQLGRFNKEMLLLFFTHSENILTDETLVTRLWGYNPGEHARRNLRIYIKRLKDALMEVGLSDWIINVRGEGYMFQKSVSSESPDRS